MAQLSLVLCDNYPAVVDAWQSYFAGIDGVEIRLDELLAVDADALVWPSNSFGRMDNGLGTPIIEFFGEDVELEIQRVIQERYDSELLVGQATVIITNAPQFPFLISAPTMRVPQNVSRTINAYLAFRAALLAVRDFNALHGDPIQSLLVPGLCTANGYMPPLRAARQMRAAYDTVIFGAPPNIDISLDAGMDSDDKSTVRENEALPPF